MHKCHRTQVCKKHIGKGSFFRQNWKHAGTALFHEMNGTLTKGMSDVWSSDVWSLLPPFDSSAHDCSREHKVPEQDVSMDVRVVMERERDDRDDRDAKNTMEDERGGTKVQAPKQLQPKPKVKLQNSPEPAWEPQLLPGAAPKRRPRPPAEPSVPGAAPKRMPRPPADAGIQAMDAKEVQTKDVNHDVKDVARDSQSTSPTTSGIGPGRGGYPNCEKVVRLFSAGENDTPDLEGMSLLVINVEHFRDPDTYDFRSHAGSHPAIKGSIALKLCHDFALLRTIHAHVRANDKPCIMFRCRRGRHRSVACVELIAECLWLSGDVTDILEDHVAIKSWPLTCKGCLARHCGECCAPCEEIKLVTDAYLSLSSEAPSLDIKERQRLERIRRTNRNQVLGRRRILAQQ